MKILELTNYSAGICGVWQRVRQESLGFSKLGHEVRVFSSNATKGSEEISSQSDSIGSISIQRFPFKKLGGESFMRWDCVSPAIEFQPDIIIAHSYRHLHTHQAVKIKKELSKIGKPCKIFLVTHAPFGSSFSRSFFQNLAVSFYDRFIGPRILNKFDNVITITKWEEPFLEDLDVNRSKIKYVPNGIPDEFFSKMKLNNSNQRLFFLGRIDPIKDLETLIYAMEKINVYLDIIGPSEGNYLQSLKNLTKELDIKNIQFNGPIYDLSDKINLIDDHSLFILPSKRESMPQSLIESMARGKIVISSDNFGGKEMIQNSRNGFLFPIGDSNQLSKLILYVLKLPKKEKEKISINAKKTAERFKWSKIIRLYEI